MTDDYIPQFTPKIDDRMIRSVYTPKEVVHIIKEMCEFMINSNLTYSEKLLIREVCNTLIWRFKDD